MEKDFVYIELFDIYKGLLTDKQREIFTSHYLLDLSLSEIAEPDGLTRQSVYDTVKKVKAKLLEYEKVLGLQKKYSKLSKIDTSEEIKKQIKEIIGR